MSNDRGLTAGVEAAIAAGTVRPALLVEIAYVSLGVTEYWRLFTGQGVLSWNGENWYGGGDFLSLAPIREGTDTSAQGWTVSVSGVPAENTQRALAQLKKNQPGRLWLALFDGSMQLIPDPIPLRRGRFDFAVIERDGLTCTITGQYEDRLVDLERPRTLHYTTEDQAIEYPGDRGFSQVEELQNAQFEWG